MTYGTFPALLLLCVRVYSASIDFGPQSVVFADGVPLDVMYVSSATVTDWDGDGLPDLLVGSLIDQGPDWSAGKLSLFLNSGTPDSPVYTYSTFLQADGQDIEVYWDS